MSAHVNQGDLLRLTELIRDIRIGLLTTLNHEGAFHTRPVETLRVDADGTLWFFTDWSSPKVAELEEDFRVSLGYADPAKKIYVAISGTGQLRRDLEQAKRLWSIDQRAYYPQGPEDSRLAVLRIQLQRAEYWIAPGRLSYLVAAAEATLTGKPVGIVGDNRKVR